MRAGLQRMRQPVLILQNLSADGPSYLRSWLQRHGVPFELRDSEAGDDYPRSLDGWGALALLGGEMSANDELPSLRRAEQLVREAVARGVPTIGHCLGGQLMARALGGRVVASPAPEVGWQQVRMLDEPLARTWFGAAASQVLMQWHRDAIELPPGAVALATSDACPVQAFAFGPGGQHLGLQFHLEIDEEKALRWAGDPSPAASQDAAAAACAEPGLAMPGPTPIDPTQLEWRRWQREHPRSVQGGAAIAAGIGAHLPAQQRLADRVYRHWLASAR